MGLDTTIYAQPAVVQTPREVRATAAQMAATIGTDAFWIVQPTKENPEGRHALSIYDRDGYVDPSDEKSPLDGGLQTLEVNTMMRYYGVGYERGPWMTIRAILEFLRRAYPDGKVFYGGDGDVEVITDEYIDEMDSHYYTNGHAPYRGYTLDRAKTETCAFCADRPMNNVGGGGGSTFWSCDGCGLRVVTNSGVRHPVGKDEEFFTVSRRLAGFD